eukprot:COSAG01_NODE_2581_length_7412_cov_9.886857_4_plen_70_part_00
MLGVRALPPPASMHLLIAPRPAAQRWAFVTTEKRSLHTGTRMYAECITRILYVVLFDDMTMIWDDDMGR